MQSIGETKAGGYYEFNLWLPSRACARAGLVADLAGEAACLLSGVDAPKPDIRGQ